MVVNADGKLLTDKEPELVIDTTSFVLPEKHYYQQETEKTQIVLHFTVSDEVEDAYQWWQMRNDGNGTVATSYVVGKELEAPGQTSLVCQFFDPKYWAWHLGVGSKWEKHAIGIEIVNEGPLMRKGDSLYWPWGNDWPVEYCDLSETHKYVHHPAVVNGEAVEYWALFPEEQCLNVFRLVRHLRDQFDLPNFIMNDPMEFEGRDAMFDIKGICSHANFRKDKFDIGPAFPWEAMREYLRTH